MTFVGRSFIQLDKIISIFNLFLFYHNPSIKFGQTYFEYKDHFGFLSLYTISSYKIS